MRSAWPRGRENRCTVITIVADSSSEPTPISHEQEKSHIHTAHGTKMLTGGWANRPEPRQVEGGLAYACLRVTQGQSWPLSSDQFLTSSSLACGPPLPQSAPRGLARSHPVVSTALRARTSVVTGSARSGRRRTMHDSGFHASVVGSNFGHCSIPLCAFPRILTAGGRPACQEGDQAGVRVKGKR